MIQHTLFSLKEFEFCLRVTAGCLFMNPDIVVQNLYSIKFKKVYLYLDILSHLAKKKH